MEHCILGIQSIISQKEEVYIEGLTGDLILQINLSITFEHQNGPHGCLLMMLKEVTWQVRCTKEG